MLRFLAGAAAAVLLMTASLFLWRAHADRGAAALPGQPVMAAEGPMGIADFAGPPAASEKTREEKRFSRYDHDHNGAVSRDEYLTARHKAFAKLDTNGDGHLSFEEYAIKTSTKFAGADRDRSGALTPIEFATTRVIRKPKPVCRCAPMPRAPVPEAPAAAEDDQN